MVNMKREKYQPRFQRGLENKTKVLGGKKKKKKKMGKEIIYKIEEVLIASPKMEGY